MNAPAVAATSIAVIMGAAIFTAIICHVASENANATPLEREKHRESVKCWSGGYEIYNGYIAHGSFTYGNGAFRFTDQKSGREFIFSADCVHRGE